MLMLHTHGGMERPISSSLVNTGDMMMMVILTGTTSPFQEMLGIGGLDVLKARSEDSLLWIIMKSL